MSVARLISEARAAQHLPSTEDVLSVSLPLLRQLIALHADGRIAAVEGPEDISYDGRALALAQGHLTRPPVRDTAHVDRLDRAAGQRAVVVRAVLRQDDDGTGSDDVHLELTPPTRPMLVGGYRAWEQLHGVSDELSDLHALGLLTVSYAAGLDLDTEEGLTELAHDRRRLGQICRQVHPVVRNVLAELVDPDRHGRPASAVEVERRLVHHRELPADLDLSAEALGGHGGDWRTAVLDTLRERVFDLTRRNTALHFRTSASTVALTEASVPLLLDLSRISASDLLVWNAEVASAFRSGKAVDLGRWCRYEESPHVEPALDKLRRDEARYRREYGQGRLHLIIAFLRWVDPETGERTTSPLLICPAELSRKKGVQARWRVTVDDTAEVNPVLRHVLARRFGIDVPDRIDSDVDSVTALVDQLTAQVQATAPGTVIDLVDTPRISLIRRRAQLRVDRYRRRRAQALATSGRWRRQAHSYDAEDWRPLGVELARRFLTPPDLPLRELTDAAPRPRRPAMVADDADPSAAGTGTGGGQTGVRERTTFTRAVDTTDADRWEVDLCAVTLAALGSRRTSLVRDYDEALADPDRLVGQPFADLFAPTPKVVPEEAVAGPGIDQMLVLPADEAQATVVRRAVRGDSFIVQGPPGTGKSQTIANMIGALVAEGRRVLFVCEKRAALDVVAHRLRQVGLGDLTATIHDAREDRRPFIAELGATYEAWAGPVAGDAEGRLQDAREVLRRTLAPLDTQVASLADDGDRPTTLALVQAAVAGRSAGHDPADLSDLLSAPGAGVARGWFDIRDGLADVRRALSLGGLDPRPGAHAALAVRPAALRGRTGDLLADVRQLGVQLVDATRRVAQLAPTATAGDLAGLAGGGAWVALLRSAGAAGVLDAASPSRAQLVADVAERTRLAAAVAETEGALARWRTPLPAVEARAALAVATAKEGAFLRALDGRWRQVKRVVTEAYDFDAHQIRPAVSAVLTELVAAHQAVEAMAADAAAAQQRYGTPDVAAVLAAAEAIGRGSAAPLLRESPDPAALGAAAAELGPLVGNLLIGGATTVGDLVELGQALAAAPAAVDTALRRWAALGAPGPGTDGRGSEGPGSEARDVDDRVLRIARTAADPEQIEQAVVTAELRARRADGRITPLTGADIDLTVDAAVAAHRTMREAVAEVITDRVRRRFAADMARSQASSAGWSAEDKAWWRAHREGRRLLEREFTKKMRHRPIRELASGDAGLVVSGLRPIWLMSPLSVADTLPLDPRAFDVVIFDEASQIPVEDAVPTVLRAAQTIVVGDRMQLPPTRFFGASADGDEEDEEIVVDEDGHRLSVSLEADSFLTQAEAGIDDELLRWHYRSRSEQLIAYSNAAFYGGRLATVPDTAPPSGRREPIVVDGAEQAQQTVEDLLARPLSFHRLRHGIYSSRRNEPEAQYIAELVRATLARDTGLTIGIVAFSEAQQGAIEEALGDLASDDGDFAALLVAEQDRVEDDGFVGLFVKNLENVQGDERDLIIMSVCYGPDPDGRMRMNFGPINTQGGERRLNVIFSRSKRHMAIVSSIDGAAITNTHNDGAAQLRGFLEYAAATSDGDARAATAVLDRQRGGPPSAGEGEGTVAAVSAEIAGRMAARGVDTEVGVGMSSFTVDVVLRSGGSLLGVLVDPPAEATPAVDRWVARPAVLDAFGWPISRVVATEWWADPDGVCDRLAAALARDA